MTSLCSYVQNGNGVVYTYKMNAKNEIKRCMDWFGLFFKSSLEVVQKSSLILKMQHLKMTKPWEESRRKYVMALTCLCDSSRCFMRTATTTLTRTNWAMRTNTTKNMGATYWFTQQFRRQSSVSSHSSLRVSFIIPFQLSPIVVSIFIHMFSFNLHLLQSWTESEMPFQRIESVHVRPDLGRDTPRRILKVFKLIWL